MPSSPEIVDYLTKAAIQRGIDPVVARRVAESEALQVFNPNAPDQGGDEGSSFGPFQLHYGGVSQSMPHPGLGDEFTKKTGLNARDPSTWKQQIDFSLDYAKSHGWGSWMGAKKAGIVGMAGIGGGPGPGQQATPVPPAKGGPGGGTATGQPASDAPTTPTAPAPPDFSAYNAMAAEQASDPFSQLAQTLGAAAYPQAQSPSAGLQGGEEGIVPPPEFASAAPPPGVGHRPWDAPPEIAITDATPLAGLFKIKGAEDIGQARMANADSQGNPIRRRTRG